MYVIQSVPVENWIVVFWTVTIQATVIQRVTSQTGVIWTVVFPAVVNWAVVFWTVTSQTGVIRTVGSNSKT